MPSNNTGLLAKRRALSAEAADAKTAAETKASTDASWQEVVAKLDLRGRDGETGAQGEPGPVGPTGAEGPEIGRASCRERVSFGV